MTRGRPIKEEAYINLVKHYNRYETNKMECECGKILPKTQYEKHLTSQMHIRLLSLKNRVYKKEEPKETNDDVKELIKLLYTKLIN